MGIARRRGRSENRRGAFTAVDARSARGRRGWAEHSGVDAPVFQARAHGASRLRTNAGGNSGGPAFAASPGPITALAALQRGISGRGRDAAIAPARGSGRSRADSARIPFLGAAWIDAWFEYGSTDSARISGAAGCAAERHRALASAAGNSGRAACRGCLARNAFAALANPIVSRVCGN